MPRYYFDHSEDGGIALDEDGLELPDIEAAKVEATRALAEIGAEVLPGTDHRLLAIEVRDDSAVLFRAALVFEIQPAFVASATQATRRMRGTERSPRFQYLMQLSWPSMSTLESM